MSTFKFLNPFLYTSQASFSKRLYISDPYAQAIQPGLPEPQTHGTLHQLKIQLPPELRGININLNDLDSFQTSESIVLPSTTNRDLVSTLELLLLVAHP